MSTAKAAEIADASRTIVSFVINNKSGTSLKA
jgi:hypothetical protein